ncbi:MAG: hypothetical protein ACRC1P_01615 [Cellulosilyticaceae bacterium]
MYMNRFVTGAVVGGTLGVLGAAYVLATNSQKKELVKKGRQMIDMTNHKLKDRM